MGLRRPPGPNDETFAKNRGAKGGEKGAKGTSERSAQSTLQEEAPCMVEVACSS